MRSIALLLALFIVAPVFAEPLPPTWDEFCPQKYLNAQPGPDGEKLRNFALAGLFVPGVGLIAYFPLSNKADERDNTNYWAARRTAFERNLQLCDDVQEKAPCYMKVREMEQTKSHQDALVNATNDATAQTRQTNAQLRQINSTLQQGY